MGWLVQPTNYSHLGGATYAPMVPPSNFQLPRQESHDKAPSWDQGVVAFREDLSDPSCEYLVEETGKSLV